MATPAPKLIVDNVVTALTAITVAGGYKTTVAKVERVLKPWGDVGDGDMPWLGVKPVREAFTYQPGKQIRVVLELLLVGHVIATTDEERYDRLYKLEDDVHAAVLVDPTRGGNAIMTTVVDGENDAGDPDTPDSRGGTGTFAMKLECVYFRTHSLS